MNKWTITALLIACTLLAFWSVYLREEPATKDAQKLGAWDNPPAGIIVDMPDPSKATSLQSRIDLLVGGGGRDIYAVVTKRTHADNRAVLEASPYVVKVVNLSTNPTDASLEMRVRAELGVKGDVFIHAWPK